MAAGIATRSRELTIIDDRRPAGPLPKDDGRIKNLAIFLGVVSRYHSDFFNRNEHELVKTFLGRSYEKAKAFGDTAPFTPKFTEPYPTMSPERQRAYSTLMESYEITLEKCQALATFILENPFCVIVRNEMSMTSHGTSLPVHRVIVNLNDHSATRFAEGNIISIRSRHISNETALFLVSQLAWSSLNTKIKDLNAIFTYSIRSETATSPLLKKNDQSTPKSAPNRCCCCIIS